MEILKNKSINFVRASSVKKNQIYNEFIQTEDLSQAWCDHFENSYIQLQSTLHLHYVGITHVSGLPRAHVSNIETDQLLMTTDQNYFIWPKNRQA